MTTKRVALGERRRAVGLSQEQVAEGIGVSTTSVARWEQGGTTPKARYRVGLAKLLQVTTVELDRMINGAQMEAPNGHAVPNWLGFYSSLEQGAAGLRTFEPVVVPGLLQTAAYAEAVMRSNWADLGEDVIEDRVQARVARQQVLWREPVPLELSAVIDESVLYRNPGSRNVLADQLGHLLDLARVPTVRIQVLPLARPAAFMASFGSFHLFSGEGGGEPFILCLESLTGVSYIDNPATIAAHADLFAHLAAVALPPGESAELISREMEKIT